MFVKFYSIKDNIVGHFGGLVAAENDEAAKRQIGFQLVNSPTPTIYSDSPQDFDLFFIGSFNDEDGSFVPGLEFVCSLQGLKVKKGK